MELPYSALTLIRDLYQRGLYRQAYEVAEAHGPMRAWDEAAPRVLAGRLAIQLGAVRQGRQMHLAAVREYPANLEAIYYHARFRLEQWGPYSCWRFMRLHTDWTDAPPELRADWMALEGSVQARFMDIDRAEDCLRRAELEAGDRPWLNIEKTNICELTNRHDEALVAAQHSLELQPWFRPGVQATAHLLYRSGDETAAIDLLKGATEHIESGIIWAQLSAMQFDRHAYHDARFSLGRYLELSPMIEPKTAERIRARQSDVAYFLGENATALELAQSVDEPFHKEFATTLATSPSIPQATVLDLERMSMVARVDAHEQLAGYWKLDRVPVAADSPSTVCGLPDATERNTYEKAGWRVIDCRLDSAVAHDLIQRGVPFFLTLIESGFAIHRLVVGADPVRRSISLVENSERYPVESSITQLQEKYTLTGPRIRIAVPPNEFARLEGFGPPEAELHDKLHAVLMLLNEHSFTQARHAIDALQQDHPEHRLTTDAELAWGYATGQSMRLLATLEKLLEDHPRNSTLVIAKSAVLRELGQVRERQAWLEAHGPALDAEPILAQSLAQTMLPNPNLRDDARMLLRRSVRNRPQATAGYLLLGALDWEEQRYQEAVDLYRMAACLDDLDEQFVEAYSRASRWCDRGSEPVGLLQRRVTESKTPSAMAAICLFQLLWERGEPDQGFVVLDLAISKLMASPSVPKNQSELGRLFLERAGYRADFRQFDDADRDLELAKPLVGRGEWLRQAARVARTKPNFSEALEHVRELMKLDPVNAEGHRLYISILAQTEGPEAARSHLAEVVQRYPQVYPLQKLRAEYLSIDSREKAIHAVNALLKLCPDDAWGHRQRALLLADSDKPDEALKAAHRAGELEPMHPSQHAVLAHVHQKAGRFEATIHTLREGITLWPDHELMLYELFEASRTPEEKTESLQHIREQLHRHPHTGEGLLIFHELSLRQIEEPEDMEELLDAMEQFHDECPDLWQSHSAMVQQLAMMQRFEEATTIAESAVERFPLVPRVWVDLAELHRLCDRADEQIDALREAVAIAPSWVPAVRELADALNNNPDEDDDGEDDGTMLNESIAVLQALIPHVATDPIARWTLADRLWDADRSEEALEQATIAVRFDSGHDPRADVAWKMVLAWSDRIGTPDVAINLAKELAHDRPGDPRAWLRLARCLGEPAQSEEALSVLDKAIHLDPRNVEAHDMRAERLAMMGRLDEALAAAHPSIMMDELPLILQGRAAWIEARRGNYAAAIPPMQALVALDPEYLWGWQQLAEWYNETGRSANYLEAASELVRMRDDHPMYLTMRGEARLQTGDREGGKEDLREALRQHFGYSPAAAILFDACLADGEERDARSALAMLQEHLTGPEVLYKQLQFATRTGDDEAANSAFAKICTTPGEGPSFFMQMAMSEMRNAELIEDAIATLRRTWETHDDFNPWVVVFWLDTRQGENESIAVRLAATDKVIANYPHFALVYDRRAEALAYTARYEEALASCNPEVFANDVPIALRGRAAWIEAQRGNLKAAIKQMRNVVNQEPTYEWGWRQLTQWYDMTEQYKESLEAADHLVKLTREDPVSFAIRGEAKRALGDHGGARDDFAKAYELDPEFEAAGLQLLTEQLSLDDIEGAGSTLELLQEQSTGPLVRLRALELSTRLGDLTDAMTHFNSLASDPVVSRGTLHEATMALTQAGWEDEADEELSSTVETGSASPTTASYWVERMTADGRLSDVLDRLPDVNEANPAAGIEAILMTAWIQAEAGNKNDVATTVQRFSEQLREDDESWARAGAALSKSRHYAMAAAWLNDWKERPGLQPWMLHPLFDALHGLGKDDEAEQLLRGIVSEADDEPIPDDFHAWLAVMEAVAGNDNAALDHLSNVNTTGQSDDTKLLLAMAQALLEVATAQSNRKAEAFAEARKDLHAAVDACAASDLPPGAGRWFRRVVNELARRTGTLKARAWALWQRVQPWVREA